MRRVKSDSPDSSSRIDSRGAVSESTRTDAGARPDGSAGRAGLDLGSSAVVLMAENSRVNTTVTKNSNPCPTTGLDGTYAEGTPDGPGSCFRGVFQELASDNPLIA